MPPAPSPFMDAVAAASRLLSASGPPARTPAIVSHSASEGSYGESGDARTLRRREVTRSRTTASSADGASRVAASVTARTREGSSATPDARAIASSRAAVAVAPCPAEARMAAFTAEVSASTPWLGCEGIRIWTSASSRRSETRLRTSPLPSRKNQTFDSAVCELGMRKASPNPWFTKASTCATDRTSDSPLEPSSRSDRRSNLAAAAGSVRSPL